VTGPVSSGRDPAADRDVEARELTDEETREHRDVWLSRMMFNQFVGWPPETRSFDEYLAVVARV